MMRKTITIDDDVLLAAKAIARQQGRTLGEVLSDLTRHTLRELKLEGSRNGIPLLPLMPDCKRVTLDVVNALRDELL